MKMKKRERENFVGVLAAYAARRADEVNVVEPTAERPSAAQVSHGQYRDTVRKVCDAMDIVVYEDTVSSPGVFRGAFTCEDLSPVDTFSFTLWTDMPPDFVLDVLIPCRVKREKRAEAALLCSNHAGSITPRVFIVSPFDGEVVLRMYSRVTIDDDVEAEVARLVDNAKSALEDFMPEFLEVLGGGDVYEIVNR